MTCEFCVDGLCYFPVEHEEKRYALTGDAEAIRAWSKRNAENGGDFGGTCEFDHDGALGIIQKLLAEVERLREEAIHDWMSIDAVTVIEDLPELIEERTEVWPHIDRAVEKLRRIVERLAAANRHAT